MQSELKEQGGAAIVKELCKKKKKQQQRSNCCHELLVQGRLRSRWKLPNMVVRKQIITGLVFHRPFCYEYVLGGA